MNENIVRPDGYIGMSGTFRIFADGLNEHGLDVVKVTAEGRKVVEEAPTQFYGSYASAKGGSEYYYGYGYMEMPEVYGKSVEQLQNVLTSMQ